MIPSTLLHAYPSNTRDPFIDHVNFTAFYLGVNPTTWTILCKVSDLTPGTTNVYERDWQLSPSVPNGTVQGLISRHIHSILLAPVPAGVMLKVIHGYNDHLPGENCPQPGNSIADHCMNQQYGLDLVPMNGNTDIIAPATGIVD